MLYFYGKNTWNNFFKEDIYLLILFSIFLLYLLALGIFHYDNRPTTLDDVYTFFLIVPMILLGSSRAFWIDFVKCSFILITFALVINIISSVTISKSYHFQQNTIAELENSGTQRLVRQILAYRTERALGAWPLMLFLLPYFNNKKSAIVILLVFFEVALQVLFQKRGPIVRVFTYFAGFLFLLPLLLDRKYKLRTSKAQKLIFFGVIFISLGAVISYLPEGFVFDQVEGLVDRFEGKNVNNRSYKGGAFGIFTSENERIAEVIHMFHKLDWTQIIFGKGLGSTYLNTLEFNRNMPGTHIGVFSLVLKGGWFLFGIYFFIMYRVFTNFSLFRQSFFAMSCAIILTIINLFFWQEAFMFYSGQAIRSIMFWLMVGYLLSYKKTIITNRQTWNPVCQKG